MGANIGIAQLIWQLARSNRSSEGWYLGYYPLRLNGGLSMRPWKAPTNNANY